MKGKVDNSFFDNRKLRTMQVLRCMRKFVQTTGYINIHKDNISKFGVLIFHEGRCKLQWFNIGKNYIPYKSIQDFFK